MENKQIVKRTKDELKAYYESKIANIEESEKQKKFKKFWVSTLRKIKRETSKKDLSYSEKIQEYVDIIFIETGIKPTEKTEDIQTFV